MGIELVKADIRRWYIVFAKAVVYEDDGAFERLLRDCYRRSLSYCDPGDSGQHCPARGIDGV